MKPKIKKVLIILVLSIGVLMFGYIVSVGYVATNGYRDYVGFCSEYIDQVEEYSAKTGKYPESLAQLEKPVLSFRYEYESCRYYSSEKGYGFTTHFGLMGNAFYSSVDKKWIFD